MVTRSDGQPNDWFRWYYDISAIVGYSMPNPINTYMLNIYDLVLWHINHCRLFNAKSYLYIYIRFCLVSFYGISTIVGNSMPNPINTYILDIRFLNRFCR